MLVQLKSYVQEFSEYQVLSKHWFSLSSLAPFSLHEMLKDCPNCYQEDNIKNKTFKNAYLLNA